MTAQEQDFLEYVQSGGQVETSDWMPDDYRAKLIKFIEMHGNSELMGVLPEREWILRAPTLQRKLALTAKVQDEVGHSQLIYRVVEDLGKAREACLADLVSGKSKFHNVFHYPTTTRCTSGGSRARGTRRRASSSSTATCRRSGSSGSRCPTRSCGSATTESGSTPSPTGTSCAWSSPAMGRRRRSGSSSGGRRARRRPGCVR